MRAKELLNELRIKQTELAKTMLKLEQPRLEPDSEDFLNSWNSLRVQLSGALNNLRPATPDFIGRIIAALDKQLEQHSDRAKILTQIREDLLDNNTKTAYRTKSVENVVKDLYFQCRQPGIQFIFSKEPAEMQNNDTANRLKGILIGNLAQNEENQDPENTFRYNFFIPDKLICMNFWRLFRNALAEYKGRHQDDGVDRLLSRYNEKYLKVYCCEPIYCVHPYVVFFNGSREQDRIGYVFFYLPNGEQSIAEMSEDSLTDWYKIIYTPLQFNQKKFEEVAYQDYLNLTQ